MALRFDPVTSSSGLEFLRHCYRFVTKEWQHISHEPLPDQGFEIHFRSATSRQLLEWQVSQEWELELGSQLQTASGVGHEIDLVAQSPDTLAIVELKNRPVSPPGKNDVIVFFAKILDYLAFNPKLLLNEVCPIFLTGAAFEETALAACLGLGIHPVGPGMRPLPVLADTLRRIEIEMTKGTPVAAPKRQLWEDSCADLNRIGLHLSEVWMSSRCGFLSDEKFSMRRVGGLETVALSRDLRRLNSHCTEALEAIQSRRLPP